MKRALSFVILILLISFVLLQSCSPSNKELTAEEIYEIVSPSVVEITAQSLNGTSTGTGFFCDNSGTIVTNYHVIEGCTEATITLSNGNKYAVKMVNGYSIDKDIAILSTECKSSTPLKTRNTSVKTGETVYAIGSSLGLSGSLSNGIVSSAERNVDGQIYIQTTTPISHGNSGGPLIDSNGLVVGITSASFSDGQNLNLAIPISQTETISTSSPKTLKEVADANPQVYTINYVLQNWASLKNSSFYVEAYISTNRYWFVEGNGYTAWLYCCNSINEVYFPTGSDKLEFTMDDHYRAESKKSIIVWWKSYQNDTYLSKMKAGDHILIYCNANILEEFDMITINATSIIPLD